MAGSKSLTPKPVERAHPQKHFTLAEANRALPLVSRIVADIVKTHQRVTQLYAECEAMPAGQLQRAVQADLQRNVDQLQSYFDELADIGVELKDCETGLIDFVGRHEGRDIYLCWRLGEAGITHWHELQAGFAGRQPVSLLSER